MKKTKVSNRPLVETTKTKVSSELLVETTNRPLTALTAVRVHTRCTLFTVWVPEQEDPLHSNKQSLHLSTSPACVLSALMAVAPCRLAQHNWHTCITDTSKTHTVMYMLQAHHSAVLLVLQTLPVPQQLSMTAWDARQHHSQQHVQHAVNACLQAHTASPKEC